MGAVLPVAPGGCSSTAGRPEGEKLATYRSPAGSWAGPSAASRLVAGPETKGDGDGSHRTGVPPQPVGGSPKPDTVPAPPGPDPLETSRVAALTVIVSVSVAAGAGRAASLTLTVKLDVPAAPGVPVMTPVEDRASPAGRAEPGAGESV